MAQDCASSNLVEHPKILDMVNQSLFLKDGTLLALKFERVVHGGRGDYIELTQDQIKLPLLSKFGNSN